MKTKMKIKKKIFKGRVLDVRLEDHMLPNEKRETFEAVRHRHAGAIIPFLDKNTIILLKQYRPIPGKYFLEIPAGLLDPGETPLQCARRELEEETGYRARYFKRVAAYHASIGFSDEKVTIYKATGLVPGILAHEQMEVIQILPTSLSQARKLLKSGKIHDAKTLIALHSIL
jgi:ADP-ribose pyrophosphatase